MPSFDIVSGFDMQELDNAVNMVTRDIANRYDFKGSNSIMELNKSEKSIKIEASNDYQVDTIRDMLETRSIKRGVSIRAFKYSNPEQASGMRIRQLVSLQEGIDKENGTKINKLIKSHKLKIQSQIQGDKLRITGKKIDDLQEVIQIVKDQKIPLPLQFVNMKK